MIAIRAYAVDDLILLTRQHGVLGDEEENKDEDDEDEGHANDDTNVDIPEGVLLLRDLEFLDLVDDHAPHVQLRDVHDEEDERRDLEEHQRVQVVRRQDGRRNGEIDTTS